MANAIMMSVSILIGLIFAEGAARVLAGLPLTQLELPVRMVNIGNDTTAERLAGARLVLQRSAAAAKSQAGAAGGDGARPGSSEGGHAVPVAGSLQDLELGTGG